MSESLQMQDYQQAAQDILQHLLHLLQFDDAQLETSTDGDQIFFQITSEDTGRIIGRASQTLDAIQFILNRLMSRLYADAPYCVVDAEQYRARRQEKLVDDALIAVERVRQNGRPWRMPLLNSMERRIIHQALKDIPDITTESEDAQQDGRKRLVISLAPLYQGDDGDAEEETPGNEADDASDPTPPVV